VLALVIAWQCRIGAPASAQMVERWSRNETS
jgi:hypothetical protein